MCMSIVTIEFLCIGTDSEHATQSEVNKNSKMNQAPIIVNITV